MAIYLGDTILTSVGGGGGGRVGTQTTTNGGVDYITYSGSVANSFDVFSDSTQSGTPGMTFGQRGSTNVVSTQSDVPNLYGNLGASGSPEQNVYVDVFNDTSGGGIWYWSYGQNAYTVGVRSGAHNAQSTLTFRITIDGGTPFELASQRALGGNSVSEVVTGNIFIGTPTCLETTRQQANGANAFGYFSEVLSKYPSVFGYGTQAQGDFNVINPEQGVNTFNVGQALTNIEQLQLLGFGTDELVKSGVPGIPYETSLRIEARPTWDQSGVAFFTQTARVTTQHAVIQF